MATKDLNTYLTISHRHPLGGGVAVALALALVFAAGASAQIPAAERAALKELYYSTAGDNWTNNSGWLGPVGTECTWFGITCDRAGVHVVEISLDSNGLVGELPVELDSLAELRSLSLRENELSGFIPIELAGLVHLETLKLSGNQLYGPIPPELGRLANLKVLDLGWNLISGPLPSELACLSKLEILFLNRNQVSGPVPPWLGDLENLRILSLRYNTLSGEIPVGLARLSGLERLSLGGNHLSGWIPPDLDRLERLTHLDLGWNQLSGPIPAQLGALTSLAALNLSGNALSGPIPEELGSLTGLTILTLDNNQLTGNIPPSLGSPNYLVWLDLRQNNLTGPIPSELGDLEYLQGLILQLNQLTGAIPASLGNLQSIQHLRLEANRLSGPIPRELGGLSRLVTLGLALNELSGSIPPELGDLGNLQSLSLSDNRLSGPVPQTIGQLTNLVDMWIGSNNLVGRLPDDLVNLEKLEAANLDYDGLYTDYSALQDLLTATAGAWEVTQTVAPTGVQAEATAPDSVQVTWTPIQFTAYAGGYRVFYSTSWGGPFTLYGTRADKSASSMEVTGLDAGTTYYFAVQAVTEPHEYNPQNRVESELSELVSVRTSAPPVALCRELVVTAGPRCIASASVDDGSYDPDGGPVTLSQEPPGPYPAGSTLVTLTVTDEEGLTSSCQSTVRVVEETPPVISCNARDIEPFDAPISFTATATNQCGVARVAVTEYSCTKFPPPLEQCAVSFYGPTVTILRSGWPGTVIKWRVEAEDVSGNTSATSCSLEVLTPKY